MAEVIKQHGSKTAFGSFAAKAYFNASSYFEPPCETPEGCKGSHESFLRLDPTTRCDTVEVLNALMPGNDFSHTMSTEQINLEYNPRQLVDDLRTGDKSKL